MIARDDYGSFDSDDKMNLDKEISEEDMTNWNCNNSVRIDVKKNLN